MRKLGLIGGMSWVSTRSYYERINRFIQREFDSRASAPMAIESVNFADIYRLESDEDWTRAIKTLSEAAQQLEQSGAEMLLICANSMHKVYDEVQASVDIPILHIADCVGEKLAADGITRAALMGTRNVITENFYRRRLVSHGVEFVPPNLDRVAELERIIYDELMMGKAKRDSEWKLRTMITNFEKADAQAVVLACTELEMVVNVDASVLPIYDCMRIHSDSAAKWIIG